MRCGIVLFLAVVSAMSRTDDERPSLIQISPDDYFESLLAPAAADGEISDSERAAILAMAHRTLTAAQLEQLEQRLEYRRSKLVEASVATAPPEPAAPHLYDDDSIAARGGTAGWLDNLYFTSTLDGFKAPVDFGLNGHFSFHMGANWGFPVVSAYGLGGQIGSSVNFASFLVPSFKSATGLDDRFQSFTTLGLFQRLDNGLHWAAAYDLLFDDYYAHFELGQWRLELGYRVSAQDEVGAWVTIDERGDDARVAFPFASRRVELDAVPMGNFYWRHQWDNGADTRWWFGVADLESDFVFGGEFRVPLNDHLALIGAANFLVAPADGSTTAMTGFAYYPAGTAPAAATSRFHPVLPVANNGTFIIDLR